MKSTMKLPAFLFALTVAAIADANPAGTIPVAMTPSPAFDQVDANKDGAITKDEIGTTKELPSFSFDDADRNHDGKLSKAEYDAATKAHKPQMGG